jgi:tyrosyl-tRNA synthetase
LKLLTLIDLDHIEEILKKHNEKPELRYWQTELAKYIITTIFSKESAEQAEKISQIMFSSSDKNEIIKILNNEDKLALYKELWWIETTHKDLPTSRLVDLLTNTGLTASNGEAKKLIQSGWVFCNEIKIEDINYTLTENDFTNWICLIRKGKKNYKVVMSK